MVGIGTGLAAFWTRTGVGTFEFLVNADATQVQIDTPVAADTSEGTVIGVVTDMRTVGSMARATFAELCARPLGPQDYLAIAQRFHTLFLEDVPILSSANHHEARRLVTLVDALYEAKTKLIVLAAAIAAATLSSRR